MFFFWKECLTRVPVPPERWPATVLHGSLAWCRAFKETGNETETFETLLPSRSIGSAPSPAQSSENSNLIEAWITSDRLSPPSGVLPAPVHISFIFPVRLKYTGCGSKRQVFLGFFLKCSHFVHILQGKNNCGVARGRAARCKKEGPPPGESLPVVRMKLYWNYRYAFRAPAIKP